MRWVRGDLMTRRWETPVCCLTTPPNPFSRLADDLWSTSTRGTECHVYDAADGNSGEPDLPYGRQYECRPGLRRAGGCSLTGFASRSPCG